ncbi:MAG: carboxypeptidase regulatory-like domain-containing protein [Acidobacteriaceae bacterium]|nr:carboxypeptidase regulatory-like domain-containing protein [Acidobacteriota bacterium]MBV8807643.1 carboxypeptidase regulatory-like domain-containing protein [Acidobacteriaceae bacterium]MBV9502396.1 carboxypeptidase regulatory-like domain-containing protein [Acidobacteriaceae bacterium]
MLTGLRSSVLFLTVVGSVFGQSAELSGLVKDPSGGVVANARVEVRNEETGARRQESTNQDGFYSFPSLNPGTYEATVQADKFRTLTRDAIV